MFVCVCVIFFSYSVVHLQQYQFLLSVFIFFPFDRISWHISYVCLCSCAIRCVSEWVYARTRSLTPHHTDRWIPLLSAFLLCFNAIQFVILLLLFLKKKKKKYTQAKHITHLHCDRSGELDMCACVYTFIEKASWNHTQRRKHTSTRHIWQEGREWNRKRYFLK